MDLHFMTTPISGRGVQMETSISTFQWLLALGLLQFSFLPTSTVLVFGMEQTVLVLDLLALSLTLDIMLFKH